MKSFLLSAGLLLSLAGTYVGLEYAGLKSDTQPQVRPGRIVSEKCDGKYNYIEISGKRETHAYFFLPPVDSSQAMDRATWLLLENNEDPGFYSLRMTCKDEKIDPKPTGASFRI